jgi:hypothetical protein
MKKPRAVAARGKGGSEKQLEHPPSTPHQRARPEEHPAHITAANFVQNRRLVCDVAATPIRSSVRPIRAPSRRARSKTKRSLIVNAKPRTGAGGVERELTRCCLGHTARTSELESKRREGDAENAKQQLRELREQIRERLREKGLRRVKGDDFTVAWTPVKGRTSCDTKALKEAANRHRYQYQPIRDHRQTFRSTRCTGPRDPITRGTRQ